MARAAVDHAAAGVSHRRLEQCPLTSWPGEGLRSSADHSRFRKPDCDAHSLEYHGGWLFHGIPSPIRHYSIPVSHIFVTTHYNVSTRGAAVDGLDLPFLAQIVLRPLLWLWARFVNPVAEEIVTTAAHARVAGLFLSRYFRAYRRPIIARVETIVNLSAICLAAGAIAGMYVQAVVWDYSFFWKSTLLESPGARLIIAKILFWPGALILGKSFPNIETVAAMAQGAGVPGAIWIHVFAVSAMVYIFLPRLLLVYRSTSEARKSSADGAITIDFICIREQEDSRALRQLPTR